MSMSKNKNNFISNFKLKNAEELFDIGPVTLIKWENREGWRVSYVSKNIFELTEYSVDDFITQKIDYNNLIYIEDKTRIKEEVKYYLSNNIDNYLQSYRIVTKTGKIKWIYDATLVVRNEHGEIEYLLGYLFDVTEKKLLEIEATKQKHRLENIIKGTDVGTWEWNVQTGEVKVNDRWIEMLGYNKDELKMDNIKVWEQVCHPDDLVKVNELTQKNINGEIDFYEYECRVKRKDGKWMWILDKGKILEYSPDGKPLIMFGFHIDISHIKEKEQKLINLNKLLEVEKKISDLIINEKDYSFAINKVLEIITTKSEQDRAYIFEYHKHPFSDNYVFSQRYEFAKEGIPKQIDNPALQNIDINKLASRWFNLLSNNSIFYGNIKDFPDSEKLLLMSQEIISLLVVPIFIENKFWGFIGFDNCKEEFNWSDFEINLLKYAGNAIANLLIRINYEEKIKESEQNLNLVINTSPDIICFKDGNGRWLLANQADLDLFNLKNVNYFGKTDAELADFTLPIYKNAFLTCMESDEKTWNAGVISKGIELIPKPNEADKIYEVYKIPIFNTDGSRKGLVVIGRDLTELKNKEKEILKLSLAVNQSPISIIITDINGNIEYVNQKFEEITGYTYNEVVGKKPNFLKSNFHDDNFYKNIWDTITNGETWYGRIKNKKKNGDFYWEEAVISSIKNEENEIINFIGFKLDITKQVIIEEELKKYQKDLELLVKERTEKLKKANEELLSQILKEKILEEQLQEALSKEKEINELRSKFIASVSHEFRTPLAALLSSTEIIKRYGKTWDDYKLYENYERIDHIVKQLTQLLDEILTISQAEKEVLKNEPENIDIIKTMDTYVEDLKPIIKNGQKLIFEKNIDKNEIKIDKKLFGHIFRNLLSNSIKYSKNDSIIKIEVIQKNNVLTIKFIDDGIGIPENEIKNIFQPFYRAENTISYEGTGLGLNIVKRCVEIMKGTISVESKLNEGTTFIVRIPFQ